MTPDGYKIVMFRVFNGAFSARKPVFLQHGLFSDSTTWVVHGPESLAFQLANQGYDVWCGNNRGNQYGRAHLLDIAPKDFFDYSFWENAQFDTVTQIEHALQVTGHRKLSYVGHSQGTTQMFSLLSASTRLHDKIDLFVALAPIVYLSHQQEAVLREGAHIWSIVYGATKLFHIYEINDSLQQDFKMFCSNYQGLCDHFHKLFHGQASPFADAQADWRQNQIGLSSASTRQICHFSQLIASGNFAKFDYGAQENIKRYGQKEPEKFNLSNIPHDIPIALLVGK